MKKEISEIYNLINDRNIDKAYIEAKRLYQIDSENLEIIKILAFLHIQKSQFQSAIDLLNNFYEKRPKDKDFDYYANLGISYKSLEDFKKALEAYEKARDINPESPLSYTVPAEIFLKLNQYEKANELINTAISKINPSLKNTLHFPNAIKLKTEINVALNKDKENEIILLKILNENFNPDIFYLLALVNSKSIDESLLKKAESYLKGNSKIYTNKLDRFWYVQPILFGLAIYYANFDKEKSENYFHLGNAETMNSIRYNSFSYQQNINETIQKYEDNFLNLKNDQKQSDKNNFFILGTPRSGTTLIESIIGSNTNVTSGGELLSASSLIQEYINKDESNNVKSFIEHFTSAYISRTNYIKGESKYIIDKLPENFLFIGYILKIIPGSKIIRTFRNPWDVAVSLYKQRYVTNIPYSASFFNIGVFMANFEAINIYWNENMPEKGDVLDVYYEDLVEQPDLHQRKIYEFLGLNSDDYSEEKRRRFFSQTASMRQIGGQIHKKSVKKEEFISKKEEFYDALEMQRKYWRKKGYIPEKSKFFGYELK